MPRMFSLREMKRRMPASYVIKYFGDEGIRPTDDQAQQRAEKFLATQLRVKQDEVFIQRNGTIFLSNRAFNNMEASDPDDLSFLVDGGKSGAFYEGAEMAYNDVLSGTVAAGGNGLTQKLKALGESAYSKLPDSVKEVASHLHDRGVLETVAGLGAGAVLGVGIWLGLKGAKQVAQGLAREDKDQTYKGARFLFLGAEATAASAALASTVSHHAFVQGAGQVAKHIAAPAFAVVHGAIDIGQGAYHISQGVTKHDNWAVAEGVAEIGMGAGWLLAAFTATPAVVGFSCVCLAGKLVSGVVRSRKEKRRAEELAEIDRQVRESYLPMQEDAKVITLSKTESDQYLANKPMIMEMDDRLFAVTPEVGSR